MAQPAPLITLGIGPAGSVLYALTGGLDIGAAGPVSTVTPKTWAIRGGYGRYSTKGNKGYSK